jgi:hypothetical protein
MYAVVFGGFLLAMALALVIGGAVEATGAVRDRSHADWGGVLTMIAFGGLLGSLGYLAIHYRNSDAELSLGPTAERIGFGALGLVLLGLAIVVWIFGPRWSRAEDSDLAAEVLAEGPAEALGNAFWRAIGPRPSSIVLGAIAVFVACGVKWPDLPKHAFAIWLVAVDAVELFGFGALALLAIGLVVSGLHSGDGEALGGGALLLALFGVGLAVGLAFGVLDGWIMILRWLGELVF